jgi:hypothetical protein
LGEISKKGKIARAFPICYATAQLLCSEVFTVLYGALSTGAISFPIPSDKYCDLGNYMADVSGYTFNRHPLKTTLGTILDETYGDAWKKWFKLMHNLGRRNFRDIYRPFSCLPSFQDSNEEQDTNLNFGSGLPTLQ